MLEVPGDCNSVPQKKKKKRLIRKEKAEIQIVESDAMAQSASGMLEAND